MVSGGMSFVIGLRLHEVGCKVSVRDVNGTCPSPLYLSFDPLHNHSN